MKLSKFICRKSPKPIEIDTTYTPLIDSSEYSASTSSICIPTIDESQLNHIKKLGEGEFGEVIQRENFR